jgi:hypothetical protein
MLAEEGGSGVMQVMQKLLPVAAVAGLVLGAAQPAMARGASADAAVMPVGYWYDPPPRYVPGPPPWHHRHHRPPPPPAYYYAPPPPPVYYAPPPRYYRPPPPPPPGVGLYFRF